MCVLCFVDKFLEFEMHYRCLWPWFAACMICISCISYEGFKNISNFNTVVIICRAVLVFQQYFPLQFVTLVTLELADCYVVMLCSCS